MGDFKEEVLKRLDDRTVEVLTSISAMESTLKTIEKQMNNIHSRVDKVEDELHQIRFWKQEITEELNKIKKPTVINNPTNVQLGYSSKDFNKLIQNLTLVGATMGSAGYAIYIFITELIKKQG